MTREIRQGFALPAALACIVLIACLAAAAIFSAGQETQASRTSILQQQAAAYAERSAMVAIAEWACESCDSVAVGEVITETPRAHSPLESTVFITKLDSALFLVVAEGRVRAAGATRLARRIAIAVRITRDSLGHQRASPLHPHSWSAVYGM